MISHDIATVREIMFCKVRGLERLFLQLIMGEFRLIVKLLLSMRKPNCQCSLRKNWPTLTSSPHWTTTKYWIPPFCHLKSCPPPPSPPLCKGGGEGGNYEIFVKKFNFTNKFSETLCKWVYLGFQPFKNFRTPFLKNSPTSCVGLPAVS